MPERPSHILNYAGLAWRDEPVEIIRDDLGVTIRITSPSPWRLYILPGVALFVLSSLLVLFLFLLLAVRERPGGDDFGRFFLLPVALILACGIAVLIRMLMSAPGAGGTSMFRVTASELVVLRPPASAEVDAKRIARGTIADISFGTAGVAPALLTVGRLRISMKDDTIETCDVAWPGRYPTLPVEATLRAELGLTARQ
jgi:hypothetical protein